MFIHHLFDFLRESESQWGKWGEGQSVIVRKGRQSMCVCISHSYTYTHNADGLRKYLFLDKQVDLYATEVCPFYLVANVHQKQPHHIQMSMQNRYLLSLLYQI